MIALCTLLCMTAPALAQQPAPTKQTAPAALQVPEPVALIVLIRTTLVALNQANQTGNYSVLRDIAAPAFQSSNTQAQLAVAFTSLRDQRLDISSIVAVTPELTEPPQIDKNGIMRLVGNFPTSPEQVNFQLAFQGINGGWRPIGMAIGTSPRAAQPAQPVAAAQPKRPTRPPRNE
jgi:hypothetical protein